MYCKQDRINFYNILNSVIKYKTRGKIIKGIKSGDSILYEKEKDKFIKNNYEQMYYRNEHNNIDFNNGIFEFHNDIIRAIETLSRSREAGIDEISSKIYRNNVDHPIILKLKSAFDE